MILKRGLEETKQRLDGMETKLEYFLKEKKGNNIVVKDLKVDTGNRELKEGMMDFEGWTGRKKDSLGEKDEAKGYAGPKCIY